MWTKTYSLSTDFGGNFNSSQFQDEINASAGITPICLYINVTGDVIDVVFDSEVMGTELTTLDDLRAAHVPATVYQIADLVNDPTTNTLLRRFDNTLSGITTQDALEVHISKTPGIGQYSSIQDAVTSNSSEGTIYIVHPGTYTEQNPITLPDKSVLVALGSAANTIIMPLDLSKDLIVLGTWCKIHKFMLSGSATAGYKCIGRGIYFDGSAGVGAYALVEECIVKNFDTCVETTGGISGGNTLLLHRLQVSTDTAPITNGIYANSNGQIISNAFVAVGVPSPPYPIALPIAHAIHSADAGTKISMGINSIAYCTNTIYVDNDGEIEITLLTATGCDKSIYVGPNGTNSKLRATNFNMKNTITYDIDVEATDAQVNLLGAEFDESKIHNPNNVLINAQFHGTNNGRKYQAFVGDVRIGTVEQPSSLAVGEGRYNAESFLVFINTNLEVGTWTDVSAQARSLIDDGFNMFAGTAVGNCLYVGADSVPRGIGISIEVAGIVNSGDIVTELWNGISWVEFSTMTTERYSPYYFVTDPYINTIGKYQVRFGVHGATSISKKILNGSEKYWMRFRIINAITLVPSIEYIKMHTNAAEINSDGFMEYFGDSRPVDRLSWEIALTEPANASPADQDIYLSSNLGVGRIQNKFKNSSVDRIGLNEFLPMDMDTSFPIKIQMTIVGNNATAGTVEFIARWNLSNEGDTIYLTAGSAPGTSTNEQSTSTTVNVSADQTSYTTEMTVNLSGANPNPSTGRPDLVWLTIERDATIGNMNDNYAGDISIVQVGVFYVKWRDGGHLLGY